MSSEPRWAYLHEPLKLHSVADQGEDHPGWPGVPGIPSVRTVCKGGDIKEVICSNQAIGNEERKRDRSAFPICVHLARLMGVVCVHVSGWGGKL